MGGRVIGLETAIVALTSAIGLGTSILGAGKQRRAASRADAANEQIFALQQRQEAERKKQAQLQFTRQQRQIFRQATKDRALAASRAVSAGGSAFGPFQSSAFGGAIGAIAGQANEAAGFLGAEKDISDTLFDINAQLGAQRTEVNRAQSQGATGAGLFQLGQDIVSTAPTVGKIGNSLFGRASTTTETLGGWGAVTLFA